MDYYYHVLVVNGLKPLELQDFYKNQGSCLVNNPETNACSCQSGTIAKELFYTTSTEQLGGGSHGGGTTVVKDRILYQCR